MKMYHYSYLYCNSDKKITMQAIGYNIVNDIIIILLYLLEVVGYSYA